MDRVAVPAAAAADDSAAAAAVSLPLATKKSSPLLSKAKCRACLSIDRDTVQLDAFVPDLQHVRTYAQSFRQCTGLTVTGCDVNGSGSTYKWPMQLCVRCCRALEVAMHFVEMALESNRVLSAEADATKLKRKASSELLVWNQFSQEFEQFIEEYHGAAAPIEENVLYMRGAKIPRLDADITARNKPHKEDDVILFDVKYDTNHIDEEDENDGSDAKNNETFFDTTNLKTNEHITHNMNNNNYNFSSKNGTSSSNFPDVENDLIQRALYMTLNEETKLPSTNNQKDEELAKIDSIKTMLLDSSKELTATFPKNSTPSTTQISPTNTAVAAATDNPNVPLLKCSKCQFTHKEAKQMRIHYAHVHTIDMAEDDIIGLTKNQTFKCRPCNSYQTKSRTDMQKHLIDHHKIDGDFEMYCYVQQNCPACVRIFKDQRSARTHYTRVHTIPTTNNQPLEIHVCGACSKTFNQRASLQCHQRFCQVAQPVQCNFCEQQFNTIRKYELHLQQHHAVDTVHECEICRKVFKNADSLAIHRKRHSERHFQCDKCPLNYVNAAELKVHQERAHVHEEPVNCTSCGSKFQNFALLREHEQRTHQQKVWRCDNCTFETSSRARLRQHQYQHTGYPYKCPECPEEFTDRRKIRLHSKKVHTIELSDEQLAEMFRERIGYTNRYDAFSKNNSLEIPGFSDDYFNELKSLGVDYDDITKDLFSNTSCTLDNLFEMLP